MAKRIILIVLILATVGLIAGTYLQVNSLRGIIGRVQDADLDFKDIKFTTTGLDDFNPTSLLPIMQIFMGKAAALEELQLPQATSEQIGQLNLTLPPGWQIGKDEIGADKAYQTANTTVVMVEDQDGNFAVITKTQDPDPQAFLAKITNQYAQVLETSGFEINTYAITLPQGQQAQVIELQQGDMAIQIRGWVSGNAVNIVALTSNPAQQAVAQQIFESIQ